MVLPRSVEGICWWIRDVRPTVQAMPPVQTIKRALATAIHEGMKKSNEPPAISHEERCMRMFGGQLENRPDRIDPQNRPAAAAAPTIPTSVVEPPRPAEVWKMARVERGADRKPIRTTVPAKRHQPWS
ncbi:hypothetical protein D9M72_432400 [compost metagenome]